MDDVTARLRLGPGAPVPASTLADRAADEDLLDVAFAVSDSPIGELLVAVTPRGLVRVGFPGEDRDDVLQSLAARISPRVLEAPGRLDDVRRQLDEYFEGERHDFDLTLDWALAGPFARRVLAACAAIPYGATDTYRGLAVAIDAPKAARAVGNALGANPIPVIVPCHRVLRSGGALGGYGGGLHVKELLLRIEGVLAV